MYDETRLSRLSCAHFGPEHTAALLRLMRCPPSLTTLRVNTLRSTRDAALAQLRAELEARGESAAAASCTPHAALPDMITIDCTGPHDLDIEQEAVVVVDRACGEALMRGADVFAPGVIGASSGLRAGQRVAVLADRGAAHSRGARSSAARERGDGRVGGAGARRHGEARRPWVSGGRRRRGRVAEAGRSPYRTPRWRRMRDASPNSPSAPAMLASRERVLDRAARPRKTSASGADGGTAVVADRRGRLPARRSPPAELPPIIEFRALDGTVFAHGPSACSPSASFVSSRRPARPTTAKLGAAAAVGDPAAPCHRRARSTRRERGDRRAHPGAHPHLRPRALPRLGSPGVDGCAHAERAAARPAVRPERGRAHRLSSRGLSAE